MTKLILILSLFAASCASELELGEEETALTADTIRSCQIDCGRRYAAWCGTMNEPGEALRCQDDCQTAASDACETSYRIWVDCMRTAPAPAYVCHSESPDLQTVPYPRDPDRCDSQGFAWWWCELRN